MDVFCTNGQRLEKIRELLEAVEMLSIVPSKYDVEHLKKLANETEQSVDNIESCLMRHGIKNEI